VGSRGSVIPIFEKQIAEGKPITITDERMSRYFMTIKEAVQLVLQASSLAADGEIYILDMGDPVMITTLAHRLIEMSGLRPGKDVDVEIVGIRPGEKLEESLYADQSSVGSTQFPLVHRVQAEEIPEDFEIRLAELEGIAVEGHNSEVLTKLRLFPIEYEIESRYPRNQQRLARVQGT
jgi:FlaA1/EpsC-like NDP-sugar epimerase